MTSEAADSNGTDNFDTNGECVGSKGEASSKVKQEELVQSFQRL